MTDDLPEVGPSPLEAAKQAVQLQRSADEAALRMQLAFATGNFDTYLEEQAAQSKKRLDEAYERLKPDGDSAGS